MFLKRANLHRLREVAGVLIRHGFADVVDALHLTGRAGRPRRRRPPLGRAHLRARSLRQALEELGATYVKLGQLLSTRADLLPPVYIQELVRLQDRVEPVAFEDIRSVVEEELGAPLRGIFLRFEEEPVASASLAQVHRAELDPAASDAGIREAAVKVLKPGVEADVEVDLAILKEVAQMVSRSALGRRYDFVGIAAQLEKTLRAELDLNREAANADRLRESLREFPRLRIPRVAGELTRRRILVSEFVDGHRLSDEPRPGGGSDPEMADQLWRAYLKQILVDGAFHCDPHPGNFLIDPEGRIALLDHGMVAYVSRETQLRLMALLLALVERDGDRAAHACIEIGVPGAEFREQRFKREVGNLVALYSGVPVGELALGDLVMELVRISFRHDIQIPPEMMLLGKTLLNLEPICRRLDPRLDPVVTMKEMASSLLTEHIARDVNTHRMLAAALELRSMLYDVPANLRRFLARVSSNDFRLGIQVDRSEEMLIAIQKVANRITLGLITAALIVGSAMLLNVDAGVKVWGYPLFALVGFLLATGIGFYLVAKIILVDKY